MKSRDEIPTFCLIVAIYLAFGGISLSASWLPLPFVIFGLALVIALHSSLQHEVLHGHPFRSQVLSEATVFPALGLFLPYLRFKDTHLAHHFDPNLTDPYDDPESNFLDAATWERMPAVVRLLAWFNNTLFGRMVVGPAIGLVVFFARDAQEAWRGNRRIIASYFLHVVAVAPPVFWVIVVTSMPFWAYVLAAYVGMSLVRIRTFLEHQAHERSAARSVIIEDKGPLAFLFLNNNYHAVHHAHPKIVWHRLPQLFESRRDSFLQRNGGYTYRSYAQIFGLHFLKAKDPVAHPIWTEANRSTPKTPRS